MYLQSKYPKTHYLRVLENLRELILSEVFYNTDWDFEDLMDDDDLVNLVSQDEYLEVIEYFIKKLRT
tara:strand:- start:21372 stop:21572 length:201 start_codon:yes stop_codon:yes gene_type:complete